MAARYTTSGNTFLGVTTLTASDDGTLSAALAAGNMLMPVTYVGGAVPAAPAGQVGLLVDGIAGASVSVPAGYGGVIDGAPGASTIDAGANALQQVLLSPLPGNGPVTFLESGGSGTVYGGVTSTNADTHQSSFGSGNGDHSLFELGGGTYSMLLVAASQTVVAAGGAGNFSFIDGGDVISLADGSYTVNTGFNDVVVAGDSNSRLGVNQSTALLGSGNDTVTAEGGVIFGGSGHDSIAVASSVVIANATANLLIYLVPLGPVFGAADTVFGGAGSVTTTGSNPGVAQFSLLAIDGVPIGQGDLLVGGSAGNNVITAIATQTTIFGGGAGDILSAWNGAAGGDIVVAGPGAETVLGAAAAPTTSGAAGGNLLVGGTGPDLILGGSAAHDTILSGSGSTTIASGTGGSLVVLGGAPALVSLDGADTLIAQGGPATIGAAQGALVFGGSGALIFANGAGASTVTGGAGTSTIYAGGGGVFAGGTGGGNLFVGGTGDAVFFAGAGTPDVFQFNAGVGGASDVIAGFDPTRDRLMLGGFGAGAAATALATATVAGGSTTIALPDATRITLYNVTGLTPQVFA